MEMMEVPNPKIINNTDVLIRMKTLGVCGSDIHYYTTGKIGCQEVQYPFTVGHEGAGEVVAVGKAVKSVKPGDRIALEPAMPCQECDQCLADRPHTCRNLKFLGCPGQAEGCLSEYLVMPETSCFKIDDSLSYEEAALMEPLAIGIYAKRLAGDLKNKDIGILGFGPIGMSVLLASLQEGIRSVFVSEKIDERLKMAKKSGANLIGNPDNTDVVKLVNKKTHSQLDIIFECCGQQEAADQALQMLKPGGKLVVVGIPEFDRWSFDADDMRRKEIFIQNVRRQNHAMEECHDLILSKKVNVRHMVTHHFALSESQEAFNMVADYKDGVMKAIINF